METRNENLVQNNGNVYDELKKSIMKYQKSLENLERAISQLSMYLFGERLVLEELERIDVMHKSMNRLTEFLEDQLYNNGEGSSE